VRSEHITTNMNKMASNIVICLVVLFANIITAEEGIGARKLANKADTELTDEGTGKLYFTGPGYTVNLVPHAIVLGLLTFALIFLYGDALFGATTDTSGYGAPATGYGAPSPSYEHPSPSYSEPTDTYGAPSPSYSAPASGYSAPSSSYNAANRYYDPYAANAATGLGSDGNYGQATN